MKTALELIEISYSYSDGTRALDNIGFRVESGDCLGLVGPSGAGKSTLGNCLIGACLPQSGKIFVDGMEVNRKNLAEIRKKVGYIFQNPDDQLFMPTLFDDVAFGLVERGVDGDELNERVAKALKDRGLEKLANKFPGHLSGGQKRLAALAGVLVMEPEVLILDEPSSNLDPRSRRNLINQLGELKNTRIVTGHDLEMVLDLCNRVLLLREGALVADGDPRVVLADKELMERTGLEVPHSLNTSRHTHRIASHKHEL